MTRVHREAARYLRADEQRSFVVGNRALALHQRGGFTLVELLVVIGIIAALAALIVPAVFQARVYAKNAAIKAEIDMLHMAIMNYKNEYGSFPPSPATSGEAFTHIQQIFPRSSPSPSGVTVDTALVGWLGGYSRNPMNPLSGDRVKLFDFDQNRVDSNQYHPTDKPGSPYKYISKDQYPGSIAEINPATNDYFNPDTFQILCAGQDEEWGPNSDDDLSNFWKGTRKDYLDSLQ